MSELEHLARLVKGGKRFEIVIRPDEAMAFKEGRGNVTDALVYPRVFTDAKKGLEASHEELSSILGTSDVIEVATKILKEGQIQVGAEYRAKKREQKHKQIVAWIHQHAVNTATPKKLPHPPERIETAMAEAKIHIDEYKSVEEQVEKIVDKLKSVLAITIATKQLKVIIPAEHAAKCYHILHSFGKVLREKYGPDGSWIGEIEIPGGMEPDFYDKLNAATHGHNEVHHIP